MIKRFIGVILVLTIIILCMPFTFAADDNSSYSETGNSTLSISVDEEQCIISVENKNTGEIFTTNPVSPVEDDYTKTATLNDIKSQLIVSYYDSENKKAVIGSYLSSVKRKSFKITKSKNKIRIDYDFSRRNEQFIIPVEYSVENNQFQVRVLTNEIEEYGEVKINEISVLPYFLRATKEDVGYILVPDGSGAIIDIASVDVNATAYKQRVYGDDYAMSHYYCVGNEQTALMPVYGMSKGGKGVLAVITGNESMASVCAEKIGITSSYSRAWTSFIYRVFDTVTISGSDWRYKEYVAVSDNHENSDFTVKMYFLSDGKLGTLAKAYRKHLNGKTDLKKRDSQAVTGGALKVYGLTTKKTSFLGIPYTKTVVATGFYDLDNILQDICPKDMKLSVFLKDFDYDSFNNRYPSNVKWQSKVNKKLSFEELNKEFSEQVQFYQIKDTIYKTKSFFSLFEQSVFAKTIGKETLYEQKYSLATNEGQKTGRFALNAKSLSSKTEKLLNNAVKKKESLGIALENVGSKLYSDFSESKYTTRTEMQKTFAKIPKRFSAKGINTAVQGGNVYLCNSGNVYYDIPVSSSKYNIEKYSVPFYQMVLQGYVTMISSPLNMMDDPKEALLNCIQSGTIPCFAITNKDNTTLRSTEYKQLFNTCYSVIGEEIKVALSSFKAFADKTKNSEIIDYYYEDGVSKTEYENGVVVIVNFNENTVNYNGISVEPKSFVIL